MFGQHQKAEGKQLNWLRPLFIITLKTNGVADINAQRVAIYFQTNQFGFLFTTL